MKKTIVYITIAGAIVAVVPFMAVAQAATPEATKSATQKNPTPTKEKGSQQAAIDDLKKKVESKVSQLKNSNKKTIAGFVTNIKGTKVSIQSDTESYDIDIDKDVTTVYKVNGSSTSEVDADTIKKDDYLLVNGPEIGKSVTANAIYIDEHFISKSGKIIEVNSDNYYIKVSTLEKDTYTLDIERSTTDQMLNIKTLKLEPVGFSKLKEGDNIHFTAKKGTDKDENRYSAVKTIIIPQEYFNK
jgi:hypothetical protein